MRVLHLGFVAALLCAPLASLVGCSGSSHVDESSLAVTTLPPTPPLCSKTGADLLTFVKYNSPNCSGGACLPTCTKDADCPAATSCDTAANLCRPRDCTSELGGGSGSSVCDSATIDTICNANPTSGSGSPTANCGLPPTCADDTNCPCGSYCDGQTHQCRLDCLTGPGSGNIGLGCPGGTQCDTRGHCSSPTTVPAAVVTLSSDPPRLQVPRDAGGHFITASLTVKISTTDLALGSAPTPPVTVSVPNHVTVACAGQSFVAGSCTIPPMAFTLLGTTLHVATQVVQIKVADDNSDPEWDINLSSPGLPHATVVPAVPRAAAQQAGRYAGTLDLGAGGTSTPIPIQATVTATAIELHDAAHLVAPTGAILLMTDGSATATSFLGGAGDALLYNKEVVQLRLVQPPPVVDPVTGQLSGSFTMSVTTSGQAPQTMPFTLTRVADLTDTPCPQAESFDTAVNACIPGIPWDSAPTSTPASFVHARANAWLNVMTPRTHDFRIGSDNAEQLAENLLCFDNTTATPGFFKQVQSGGVSGDLQCGSATASHNQWGVGLISFADRVTPGTALTQFEMLAQCLQQLMTDAPPSIARTDITNNSCVSVARFYPALFSTAGAGAYEVDPRIGGAPYDQRSRLLMVRLLQQWSEMAGFIARDGTQARASANLLSQLTDPDTDETKLLTSVDPTAPGAIHLTYGSLLDALDNAWLLLLDQRIEQPLLALPSRVLANPDYRQLGKPLALWTFASGDRTTTSVTNLGSGPPLATSGCTYNGSFVVPSTTCTAQATLPGLDQNVTFSAVLSSQAGLINRASTLIDSDGLVVKLDKNGAGATILEVGHRIADGSTPLVSFLLGIGPFNGPVIVQRDARTKQYTLLTGPSNTFTFQHASYTSPPAISSDTISVGASRTNKSDFSQEDLSQVALWDSGFGESHLIQLLTTYDSVGGTPHALWPADVVLPAASDPNANEAAVGLPVHLLEGLIATMGAVEAFVKDAALDNVGACRRGTTDDGLQRAKDRAARALRVSYEIQQLATTLHASAVTGGAVAWETRYQQALTELLAARTTALHALTTAGACENPLGVGPLEFPLYFGDSKSLITGSPPPSNLNVIEASAIFLMNKATTANGTATAALSSARSALKAAFDSGVQQQQAQTTADQRLDDIRASFGKELVDTCGIAGQDDITVLKRFLDPNDPHGHLAAQNCFVQETAGCAGTENLALSSVNPSCLRGQIGEALLATESARQRVTRAITARDATIKVSNTWLEHCAEKADAANRTKHELEEVRELEDLIHGEENAFAAASGFTSGLGGIFGAPSNIATGLFQFVVKGFLDDGFVQERNRVNALIQEQAQDEAVADCAFQAAQARIPVDTAEQDIVVASSDLQSSLAHVRALQDHVSAVAKEAEAAIVRENGRTVPRLAFHYWADESLALYLRDLERARRMTYLFLRAVEHDLQRNFGLDHQVLAATHPAQLTGITTDLSNALAGGIEGLVQTQHHAVISLCEDVLRLPQLFNEADCHTGPRSAQRLREILLSPANSIFDDIGYAGQALPFTLDPSLAKSLVKQPIDRRCAENLAQVDARFDADNITSLQLTLQKRETFFSSTCPTHLGDVGSATYQGTLRSSNNLLLGDGTIPQFGQDRVLTPALIDSAPDTDTTAFEISDVPGGNAAPDLAGRGVYGDYVLVVPPAAVNTIAADTGDLKDIRIRLDYVSVAQTGSAPVTTSPLATEMRDGNDALITSPNSISATCSGGAPNCQTGTVATLSANASAGWHFASWSGACSGSDTTCTVPMNGPRKAWATFVNDDPGVAITASQTGTGFGGIASGWFGVANGSQFGGPNLPWQELVPANSMVTLFASAADNSLFTGWSGGGCSGTDPCTVAAASALSVSANFTARRTVTLKLSVDSQAQPFDGTGVPSVAADGSSSSLKCDNACTSATGALCTTTCTGLFEPDEPVSVTLLGTDRYSFISWADDCSGAGACTLTMSADHVVTVNFKLHDHFSVGIPTNGQITGPQIFCGNGSGACDAFYTPGSTVTMSASPNLGFKLTGWSGAAAVCGVNVSCPVSVNALSTTIGASFGLIGVCVPGASRSCCACGSSQCCGSGDQVCNSSGQWGTCSGSECAPPGHECR